jgi:hypothetical protein
VGVGVDVDGVVLGVVDFEGGILVEIGVEFFQ